MELERLCLGIDCIFIDSSHRLWVLTQRFEQLVQILLVDHLEVAYE